MDQLGSANDIDGPNAFLFREDDDGSPYCGICGVLNDPIASFQGNELFEKQCCRRQADAEHRRLLGVDLRRQHDRFLSRRQHLLSPREYTVRDHDTVACFDVLYGVTGGQHFPSSLVSYNGWKFGFDRVEPAGNEQVAIVDGRVLNANQDLVRFGITRFRDFHEVKAFLRFTAFRQLNGLHQHGYNMQGYNLHMHVSVEHQSMSANRVSSGRSVIKIAHLPSGRRDRIRFWARSHAGRACLSLAAPAAVRRTSFSRRSSPGQMATQPASISGRRFRVRVVSSRCVSATRSRWRTLPACPSHANSAY